MKLDYDSIKAHHRKLRDKQTEEMAVRIHRSLSWWKGALSTDNLDHKFLSYWIAFNAAYAQESTNDAFDNFSERESWRLFLQHLVHLDYDNQIYDLVWENYSDAYRLFFNNKFVHRDYWKYRQGEISQERWDRSRSQHDAKVKNALAHKDTLVILKELFDRTYFLRNQIIHGGSTWNGEVNREQLNLAVKILEQLLPVMIIILLENDTMNWGDVCYLPVDE